MDIWLFELLSLVSDTVLNRKGLKSATAAWLAALLLIGFLLLFAFLVKLQFQS
jgi:hypothetical protein